MEEEGVLEDENVSTINILLKEDGVYQENELFLGV